MHKKQSIIEYLAGMDKGALYLYLLICIGCGAAMLINMVMQNVGLSALDGGTAEEQKLLLLTAMVVTICAAGMAAILLAMQRKKEWELYKKSASNRKKR